MTRTNHDIRSLLAQADHYLDEATGAVVPPIHASVTYARDSDYEAIGEYFYTRYGNPNFTPVERLLAKLDGGADALLFASGLAGVAALVELVGTGQHIVAPQMMYFGAQAWMQRIARTAGSASPCSIRRSPVRSKPPSGPARPPWSGSRRRPTRPGTSSISPRRPRSRTGRAPCSPWTAPSRPA